MMGPVRYCVAEGCELAAEHGGDLCAFHECVGEVDDGSLTHAYLALGIGDFRSGLIVVRPRPTREPGSRIVKVSSLRPSGRPRGPRYGDHEYLLTYYRGRYWGNREARKADQLERYHRNRDRYNAARNQRRAIARGQRTARKAQLQPSLNLP